MPDSKPRCVHPRTSGAACGKTEAQHGPATGHAFTLEHIPEPDTSARAMLDDKPTPIRPAGQQSTPCPVCRRLWTGEPGALFTCVGRPGQPDHTAVYFKIGDGTPLVQVDSAWQPFTGHPDGCEHLEHTPSSNPECVMRPAGEAPAMQTGDPLEGVLLSGAPNDPTVTLRAESPDGTLVEVVIAHPRHDHVKMARAALVAVEYVLGRVAHYDDPDAGSTP